MELFARARSFPLQSRPKSGFGWLMMEVHACEQSSDVLQC